MTDDRGHVSCPTLVRDHKKAGGAVSYFVTVKDGQRVGYLAGPFKRHGDALRMVEPAKRLAKKADSWSAFYAFGTARVKVPSARVGLFNVALGLEGGENV